MTIHLYKGFNINANASIRAKNFFHNKQHPSIYYFITNVHPLVRMYVNLIQRQGGPKVAKMVNFKVYLLHQYASNRRTDSEL